MMIIPVVYEGQETVTAYIPDGLWYSMRESDYGNVSDTGTVTFSAPTTDMIPVLLRGGSIIPRQKAELTTTASRKNPFELLIALGLNEL
ncbi:unnamed protein product [Gongylonema pulchrum]|uniref:Alpha-xylosidase n=1 Tax=Gongylonema pulchrum TaxID=637853 RepID=A0A183EG96_9BILA|nr:unnamed protein product [Gongylonema pulchrum]